MRSFWLEEALRREPAGSDAPRLSGRTRTDVCIVGGGYTGLWTALQIKSREPGAEVAILEADICGGGASGRNNGLLTNWASKATTLANLGGRDEGIRLVHASLAVGDKVRALFEQHGLDIEYRQTGALWTATNPVQVRAIEQTMESQEKMGIHVFESLRPDEVVRRSGSERNIAGLFQPDVATVQPALLARGLRRLALEAGVRIYEHSAMRALSRGSIPEIRTPDGSISAETVVLALDAWAAQLPDFRRTVLALAADSIMTEPVPNELAALGLADGFAMTDARMLVNVFRTTVGGRLNLGKGGGGIAFAGRVGERFDGRSPIADRLTQELHSFYPSLARASIVSAWRGPVSRTDLGLPFFGRLRDQPNIVYGHGYSGNGVGPSYIGGQILASLALRQTDEWSTSALARPPSGSYPPEPLRYMGGRLVRAAVVRKERAEDQGRRPGRITLALSRLAPSGPGSPPKN